MASVAIGEPVACAMSWNLRRTCAQQAASVGFFAWDAQNQEFFLSRIARQIYGLPATGRIGLRT